MTYTGRDFLRKRAYIVVTLEMVEVGFRVQMTHEQKEKNSNYIFTPDHQDAGQNTTRR